MNPIEIAAFIGIMFSLPALLISCKRLYQKRDILSFALTSGCVFITATFISAYLHALEFIATISMPDKLDWYFNPWYLAVPLIIVAILLNLTMFIVVRKTTYENLWKTVILVLCGFIVVNLCIAGISSIFTGLSFNNCFFASCCASLGISGLSWGLTYKEICVIGNIYIQTAIVFLSTLYIVWMGYRRNKFKTNIGNFLLMLFLVLYGFMMFAACYIIIIHYALPLEEAYDLCYKELVSWARSYGMTYFQINYYIFIIGFLIITIGNILFGRLLRIPPSKRDLHKIRSGHVPLFNFDE